MSASLLGLVLLAALLHASWNALVKGGGDRLVLLALMTGAAGLAGALALPWLPPIRPEVWPFLAATGVVHVAYNLLLLAAYRHGDLSHVYPIARGSAVLLTAAGSLAFVGERLAPTTLAAVGLIAGGVLTLGAEGGQRGDRRAAVGFALATGVSIAAYTLLDGLGARRSGSVEAYVAWLFVLNGVALPVLAAVTRRGTLGPTVRANWRAGVGGGLMSMLAYGIALYAMTAAPLAPVAALRETSVLFASVLGVVMLKEPFGGRRVVAAVAVAAGIVLLGA